MYMRAHSFIATNKMNQIYQIEQKNCYTPTYFNAFTNHVVLEVGYILNQKYLTNGHFHGNGMTFVHTF